MSIYLGSTLLAGGGSGGSTGGGGGAGTPIGGLAFFIPRRGTTFTNGQEVYTNQDDETVWIRSGAQLTSNGDGALDASIYRDSVADVAQDTGTGARFSASVRSNRFGSNFDGRNVVVYGHNNSNAAMTAFQPDGTQVFTSGDTTNLNSSASLFYNDTHTFVSNRWIANVGTVSLATSGVTIRYLETSTLTSFANYNATSGIQNWIPPTGFGAEFLACVTNAGTANERHWWTSVNSTTLTEHTFDSTATNGTSAWTSTGNTITLPAVGLGKIQADGNLLYAHVNTNLHEYNATTRELLRTVIAPTDNSNNTNESGLVLIPAAHSDSGNREFWYPTTFSSSLATPHSLYREIDTLTAPFKGTINAREAITLKDVDANTTFSADNVLDQDINEIYLWKRIA